MYFLSKIIYATSGRFGGNCGIFLQISAVPQSYDRAYLRLAGDVD